MSRTDCACEAGWVDGRLGEVGAGDEGRGGVGLDALGLGQVDPLVGEGHLELAVSGEQQRECGP